MVAFSASLEHFLIERYNEQYFLIKLGHMDQFTNKMNEEYIEWVKSGEAAPWLAGGEFYHDPR